MNPIYTIGHSNHDWGAFHALVEEHEIQRLVDVGRGRLADMRLLPTSGGSPHSVRKLESTTSSSARSWVPGR